MAVVTCHTTDVETYDTEVFGFQINTHIKWQGLKVGSGKLAGMQAMLIK